MSLPVTVEIAFGVDPFDSSTLNTGSNWTDVTGYVRSLRYQTSSRSDRFGGFVAGSAGFVLDNLDREMDPSNSGSTYAGEFVRDVPIRIIGEHSSTDYVLWYGYVRSWTPTYQVGKDATTIVEAVDALGILARYDLDQLDEPAHGRESAKARMTRVLNLVGFPSAYRDLDVGTTRIVETTWGVNALQHLQLLAESSGGFLYAQRDGTLEFDGGQSFTETRHTTSQDTWTSSEYLKQPAPTRAGVGLGFRNLVRVGGPGVETAEVDNVASNKVPVSFSKTGLLMHSSARAAALANYYADLYGTETPFTEQVSFLIASPVEAPNTALFPRKIRDRVTVELDPPGGGSTISDELFIDGIRGVIGQNQRWDVTFQLSSAEIVDDNLDGPPDEWLILDGGAQGKLDSGNKLAY